MNPKIQIKNFSGMNEKGSYYLEGFSARLVNGQSILSPTWRQSDYINDADTGFSSLGTLKGIDQTDFSSAIKNKLVGIDTSGRIFAWDYAISSNNIGLIHTVASPTANSDIMVTNEGNLIYTSARYLGWGKKATLTGGSTTTAVVDGYDFSDAGFTTGDKLYNITKKEEYTITGFTQTGGTTNDTIQFSAGTACASGDIIIVFDDNKFDLGESDTSINRQIAQYDDIYYITNGNWLASLYIDEATFENENKQLIRGVKADMISVNKDQILVGGNFKNRGMILLWDGYTDGWQSLIHTDKPIEAIKPYGSSWFFIEGYKIFSTNGYSRELLTSFPNIDGLRFTLDVSYNGMEIVDDKIFINYSILDYTTGKAGVAVYDLKYGWTVIPSYNDSGYCYSKKGGIVFKHRADTGVFTIFADWNDTQATKKYGIGKILDTGSMKSVMMMILKLPANTRLSTIGLNVSAKYNRYTDNNGSDNTISVSYGDGKKSLWYYESLGSGNTTTELKNINGATRTGIVGQEVWVLEGDYGGEKTYIESIANAGEATETWTVSPALSGNLTENTIINRLNLKKATGMTTVDTEDVFSANEVKFNLEDGFLSDKLILKIEFDATSNYLDLWQINIY